jgi:hypothetical protein
MNWVLAVLVIIIIIMGVGVSLCTSKSSPTIQTPVEVSPSITVKAIPSPSISTPSMTGNTSPVSSRPLTGTITSGESPQGGVGELILHNNDSSLDAVAALLPEGQDTPMVSVYIRHGEKYTFDSVDNGLYDLYLVFGSNWDPGKKQFTANTRYLRYSDVLNFRVASSTNPQNIFFRFSIYEFWIFSTMENVDQITPNEFPKIE